MKKTTMRLVATMMAVMMSATGFTKTPDFGGKVMNEQGEALPYVNVVLLSLTDSSFVQGAVTDEQGAFTIKTDKNEGLLKLTSVGYQTLYLPFQATENLTVQMKEDTQMLSEVVVKSQLPKTYVKGDAMRTTVAGTVLEKAGTVSDALSKIPSLEAERNEGVKVLGRGDAEVYINGRRVQDVKELSRLRSDQIQHVDVVHNPGARYAASTKAVVRIQLKKAQGEGISFQEYASGIYQYGHTLTNNIDLNYRTGGLNITASFWVGRYGHSKSFQENDLIYNVGPDHILARSNQETKKIWKGWSPQLQLNYMIDENHSLGAFYKFDRHPGGESDGPFYTDNYVNGVYTERSESHISGDDTFRKHIFNAYYNGKVGKLSIDWNADGLFDKTVDNNHTNEVTKTMNGGQGEQPGVHHDVTNSTNSSNNFWATKLILSYPVMKGNLSIGGEYSYNHRTDTYSNISSDALPVKDTENEINESSAAGFIEYGRAFDKVYAQIGLRYEHLKNDYYKFGKREDEVCRNYGDWFPTASLSMPIGKTQLSLSYRQDIERPHYSNLTSSTVYINRYTYQSGNPYLRPTYTHSLGLNVAYKWMNLNMNYSHTKDNVTMATEPYPGSSDPLLSLVRSINGSDGYDQLSIVPSARPHFNFALSQSFSLAWHPAWFVYAAFQNYKSPCADGSVITLNHPYANIGWDNVLELPKGWRVNIDFRFSSKGDVANFRITRSAFKSSLGLQRDFNMHQLGMLNLDLRCMDVFNTSEGYGTIYGIRNITSYNPARRTFMLELTWKFNEARSKYRGSGAGEKQKARM